MKKVISLILAVAMIVCMSAFSAFAEEDLVIDIITLKTNVRSAEANFPAAGWADTAVIQLSNWGENINLGAIDLSKYESITISYGRDNSHITAEKGGLYLGSAPVQNENQTENTDAVIYADFAAVMDHGKPETPVTWQAFEEKEGPLTVKLDLSNYTPGSDVYLSANVLLCPEDTCTGGPYIGFGVTYISFNVARDDSGSTGDSGDTGDTGNGGQTGNAGTADSTAVVFMIAAAAVVATVLLKKRAF